MKRILVISIFSLLSIVLYAQSEEFNKVYEACKLAQSSMSYGEASKNEIEEAAHLLKSLKWAPLILTGVNIKSEAPFGTHMVFSPEYLTYVAKNNLQQPLAEKYAKEQIASQRGGDVKLCTKCIKAKSTVTYAFRHRGGNLKVAAVAEVNGLINLKVVVKDKYAKSGKEYKISSEEFKGAGARKLDNIKVPKGNSVVYIYIENKTKEDKSVAIIVG